MDFKICYIWVENFRNFQNTGFNFASDEKYYFDREEKKIFKEPVQRLPLNFFGSSITEVTGLIGRNGSGKSNVLELVCKILKGGKSGLNTSFLIITQEYGDRVCYKYSLDKISCDFSIIIKEYDRKIDPLKVVYFSNVFDERIHNFDKDVSDISNNFRYRRNRFPFHNIISDFEKQIKFIESPFFKDLKINIPNKIKVSSSSWNSHSLNSSAKQRLFGKYYDEINEFLSDFRKRANDVKDDNKFYYLLVYSYFLETLKILNSYPSRDEYRNTPQYFIKELNENIGFNHRNLKRTEDIVKELLRWMFSVVEGLLKFENIKYRKDLDSFLVNLQNLYGFRNISNNFRVEAITEGSRSRRTDYFVFDYDVTNPRNDNSYLRLFQNQRIFNVDWVGISSGHKAYLNIFSLLFYELKGVRKENLLICIDEGDLYLHPQWQIEFFDKLLNVLPKIYDGGIQLILTSHSPFLLSDLPKQNISIIDTNAEKPTFNGIDLKKETFAGNIYNLYAEPFFLGNERTSVFAKKKIEYLLKALAIDKTGLTKAQRANLIHQISLIGDDVIRLHLLKKLEND